MTINPSHSPRPVGADAPPARPRAAVVLGAGGFAGGWIVRGFVDAGWSVVAGVRPAGAARAADALGDRVEVAGWEAPRGGAAIAEALRHADAIVVSIPPPLHPDVAAWLGEVLGRPTGGVQRARLVVISSARRHSRVLDRSVRDVLAAEAAWEKSPLAPLVLRPTMIVDGVRDLTLAPLLARLRSGRPLRLPRGPLGTVQPLAADDLAAAVPAAAALPDRTTPLFLDLGGSARVDLSGLLGELARRLGVAPPRAFPPGATLPLRLLAPRLALLPGRAGALAARMARLFEDRTVDAAPARALLGLAPRPLESLVEFLLSPPPGA